MIARTRPNAFTLFLAAFVAFFATVPVSTAAADNVKEQCLAAYKQAEALWAKGKLAEAVKPYERAVELAPRAFGAENLTTAMLQSNLAVLYTEVGRYPKAEPLLRHALKIREAKLQADDPLLAVSLNNLGEQYRRTGRYDEALPLLERSLKIKEKRDPKSTSLGYSCNNLGLLHRFAGRYEKALPYFQRALTLFEKKFGRDDPHLAIVLDNLAQLYMDSGREDRSEAMLRRSLKIFETRKGLNHPDTAVCINNLAFLYHRHLGQLDRAEPLYRRCLRIQEEKTPDSPKVAQTLTNLGTLLQARGQFDKAKPLLERSLAIRKKRLPANHPALAQSYNDLALLFEETKQFDRAELLLREALKIGEVSEGNHPHTARALTNLGTLYLRQAKYERAETLLRRALAMQEKSLGPDHPDAAISLGRLALLCALTKRPNEEVDLLDRDLHILRRHALRVLSVLPEREQLTYLQRGLVESALSTAVTGKPSSKHIERSTAWLLNGKALAREVLAQRMLLARAAKDAETADVAARLLAVRRQLAMRTYRRSPTRSTVERQKTVRLIEQEQELSRQLGQTTGRTERADPWVELAEVRRRLPAKAVLIDLARFRYRDLTQPLAKLGWGSPHYAAWIVPAHGEGEVRAIDLGEAKVIEDAVWSMRQTLSAAPARIATRGEVEAEKEVREQLRTLSKRVLQPLWPHIRGVQHWLISPDADLWLVPWAALPLPDSQYAVEKYVLSYLVSGRDLLDTGSRFAQGASVILADPDYDLAPEKAVAELKRLLPKSSAAGNMPQIRAGKVERAHWLRLPGTAAEARAVVPRIKAYTKTEPRLYLREQALEGIFKAVRQPRIVVLSTHGFFREETSSTPPLVPIRGVDWLDAALQRPAKVGSSSLENPWLRCGLVLAGANRRSVEDGREDGMLTGLEIVGVDLRGTELVVLSACETGLGQVHVGEGVAGLRQAFQLAGARNVVATLWQIPDRETSELMSGFFEQLVKKRKKSAALADAQRATIRLRRAKHKAAHPFYWAAFVLSGDWR